jgi:hypothetical protein
VDVATGLNGGEVPGSGGAAVAAPDTSDAAASDTVARAGAGAALVLGLAALGGLLIGRRRTSAAPREREE